jgi:hypothetical protein
MYSYSRLAFCLFVLASPRKNLSQGPSFGGCGFIHALFMIHSEGKFLIECLREKNTRTKIKVLAISFREPMTSLSPYLNPHISAES